MQDSLITIVAIFLAAILIFIFPIMQLTGDQETISKQAIQSATVKFVDDTRTAGTITWSRYQNLVSSVNANGGKYDIQLEVKIPDSTVGKKSAMLSGTVIGESVYYSVNNSQIFDVMEAGGEEGEYKMTEGSILSVTVSQESTSLSQSFRGLFYGGTGSSGVVAQHSGIVTSNTGK